MRVLSESVLEVDIFFVRVMNNIISLDDFVMWFPFSESSLFLLANPEKPN